jgi:hypothetical protein
MASATIIGATDKQAIEYDPATHTTDIAADNIIKLFNRNAANYHSYIQAIPKGLKRYILLKIRAKNQGIYKLLQNYPNQ